MTGFTARCLCGTVQLSVEAEPLMMANCHCDDCRRATGASFASVVHVLADKLIVTAGEPACFEHESDKGSTMKKFFCPTCGSQLFGANDAWPDRRTVRVGVIDDASWFKPRANVYASRKLPATVLDPDVKAFDKMPG